MEVINARNNPFVMTLARVSYVRNMSAQTLVGSAKHKDINPSRAWGVTYIFEIHHVQKKV